MGGIAPHQQTTTGDRTEGPLKQDTVRSTSARQHVRNWESYVFFLALRFTQNME